MKQKILYQKKLGILSLSLIAIGIFVFAVISISWLITTHESNLAFADSQKNLECPKVTIKAGVASTDNPVLACAYRDIYHPDAEDPTIKYLKSGESLDSLLKELMVDKYDQFENFTFKYLFTKGVIGFELRSNDSQYESDGMIQPNTEEGVADFKWYINGELAEESATWHTLNSNTVFEFCGSEPEPVEKTYTLNVNDYDTEAAISGAKVKYYAQNNQYDFTETEPGVYSVTVENEEDFVGYAVIYHDDYQFGLVSVNMNEETEEDYNLEKADISLCGNEQAHKGFVLEVLFEDQIARTFYLPQIHFCWDTIEGIVEEFGGFKIEENGVLSISYEGQTFCKVMPICENGYKFDHYNLNGNKVEGDTLQFQGKGDNAEIFYASVETPGDDPVVEPTSSAQTGDFMFASLVGLAVIAFAAGSILVIRKRKIK